MIKIDSLSRGITFDGLYNLLVEVICVDQCVGVNDASLSQYAHQWPESVNYVKVSLCAHGQ